MQKLLPSIYWIIGFIVIAFVAVGFNVYLASGCDMASGVITWHGKECLF